MRRQQNARSGAKTICSSAGLKTTTKPNNLNTQKHVTWHIYFNLFLFLKGKISTTNICLGQLRTSASKTLFSYWPSINTVFSIFIFFLSQSSTHIKGNQVILSHYTSVRVYLPKSQHNFTVENISQLQRVLSRITIIL